MNYRRLEKAMDKAYTEARKAQPESIEGATATAFYNGIRSAIYEMGLWLHDYEGKHIVESGLFVEIYRNEDGLCECEKCEISTKCTLKGNTSRLPDPDNPQSIGLCPKLVW